MHHPLFSTKNVTAVIWDMDGVLSDTQKFHAEVESLLLKKYGINISPSDITARYAGVSDDVMFIEIFKQHEKKIEDINQLLSQKWDLMLEVTNGKITAIPHALRLIKQMKKKNLRLAIASASNHAFIQHVIHALKVSSYFDVVVSSQEVQYGKPAPDVFLLAALRLHVPPQYCAVIEDGISGMIGAKKAGMLSIGFVDKQSPDVPADVIVSSLDQVLNLM